MRGSGGNRAPRPGPPDAAPPTTMKRQPSDSVRPSDLVARFGPTATRSLRNLHMMHTLERVTRAFDRAGVEVLALKGAVLNLLLYAEPDERPMDDLDLLVRPGDVERACAVLEGLGAVRGQPLVREDFFPRFHYEIEYRLGTMVPVKIDLHVRPFRPLRYAGLMADDALFERARPIPVGTTHVLVPSAEDMLIHLAVHAAVHGFSRRQWIEDMQRWIERFPPDWSVLIRTAEAWKLGHPVSKALAQLRHVTLGSEPRASARAMDPCSIDTRLRTEDEQNCDRQQSRDHQQSRDREGAVRRIASEQRLDGDKAGLERNRDRPPVPVCVQARTGRRSTQTGKRADGGDESPAPVCSPPASIVPEWVLMELARQGASWRDRLALWQAPRDGRSPVAHVLVSALTAPKLTTGLAFLGAVMLPGAAHMAGTYPYRHAGWLPVAHLFRWIGPLVARGPFRRFRQRSIELRPTPSGGQGVFALRMIQPGETIARVRGRVEPHQAKDRIRPGVPLLDEAHRIVLCGRLRFLNHSCMPNARLEEGRRLVALRTIAAGEEIKIDYGPTACACRVRNAPAAHRSILDPLRLEEGTVAAPTHRRQTPDRSRESARFSLSCSEPRASARAKMQDFSRPERGTDRPAGSRHVPKPAAQSTNEEQALASRRRFLRASAAKALYVTPLVLAVTATQARAGSGWDSLCGDVGSPCNVDGDCCTGLTCVANTCQ